MPPATASTKRGKAERCGNCKAFSSQDRHNSALHCDAWGATWARATPWSPHGGVPRLGVRALPLVLLVLLAVAADLLPPAPRRRHRRQGQQRAERVRGPRQHANPGWGSSPPPTHAPSLRRAAGGRGIGLRQGVAREPPAASEAQDFRVGLGQLGCCKADRDQQVPVVQKYPVGCGADIGAEAWHALRQFHFALAHTGAFKRKNQPPEGQRGWHLKPLLGWFGVHFGFRDALGSARRWRRRGWSGVSGLEAGAMAGGELTLLPGALPSPSPGPGPGQETGDLGGATAVQDSLVGIPSIQVFISPLPKSKQH